MQHILNTRFWSSVASYDVESNICGPYRGRRRCKRAGAGQVLLDLPREREGVVGGEMKRHKLKFKAKVESSFITF